MSKVEVIIIPKGAVERERAITQEAQEAFELASSIWSHGIQRINPPFDHVSLHAREHAIVAVVRPSFPWYVIVDVAKVTAGVVKVNQDTQRPYAFHILYGEPKDVFTGTLVGLDGSRMVPQRGIIPSYERSVWAEARVHIQKPGVAIGTHTAVIDKNGELLENITVPIEPSYGVLLAGYYGSPDGTFPAEKMFAFIVDKSH